MTTNNHIDNSQTINLKRKPIIRRRWLIYIAIILMIISLFTEHYITGVLIFMAIFFLIYTIFMSMMAGCGAGWAGFWINDEDMKGRL